MKKRIIAISILTASLLFSFCSGYGKKIEFNNTDVYYTSDVTENDARKLGDFLVRSKFADGKEKSIQLAKNKERNHFIFRMVTNEEAAKNKAYEELFRAVAIQISDSVFNKQPVDFHVCNNTFKTIKELQFKPSSDAK